MFLTDRQERQVERRVARLAAPTLARLRSLTRPKLVFRYLHTAFPSLLLDAANLAEAGASQSTFRRAVATTKHERTCKAATRPSAPRLLLSRVITRKLA